LAGSCLPTRYPGPLLPLIVPADVPRTPTAVERSLDLATLSHREAQRLDGRRVRVRVELESLPGDAGGILGELRGPFLFLARQRSTD
jgi:hypothetical protein